MGWPVAIALRLTGETSGQVGKPAQLGGDRLRPERSSPGKIDTVGLG